jgi:hypothetical protein
MLTAARTGPATDGLLVNDVGGQDLGGFESVIQLAAAASRQSSDLS